MRHLIQTVSFKRTLTLFLSLILGLSGSAFGLRPAGLEESHPKLRREFQRALGIPTAGLEEDSKVVEETIAFDELVQQFLPLMKRLSQQSAKRLPNRNEDPLIHLSSAMIGLQETFSKYPPSHPDFKKYAFFQMRNRIIDQRRKEGRLARVTFDDLSKLDEARSSLWNEEIRNPTIRELAQASGLTEKKVYGLLKVPLRRISLSGLVLKRKGLPRNKGELTKEKDEEERARVREEAEEIFHLYGKGLSPREQYVVWHHHLDPEPKTFEKIGLNLNLSRSRAWQIYAKAMKKLKRHLAFKEDSDHLSPQEITGSMASRTSPTGTRVREAKRYLDQVVEGLRSSDSRHVLSHSAVTRYPGLKVLAQQLPWILLDDASHHEAILRLMEEKPLLGMVHYYGWRSEVDEVHQLLFFVHPKPIQEFAEGQWVPHVLGGKPRFPTILQKLFADLPRATGAAPIDWDRLAQALSLLAGT